MVVATLHLGHSVTVAGAGALHQSSLISRLGQCCPWLCRTCCPAPSSWVANEIQRLPDCIGRSWQRAGDGRDARVAGYRAAVEGPFEIRVSYAGCGCFEGLLVAGLPDNTHRLATETSRCGT